MVGWKKELDIADAVKPDNRTPKSVDAISKSPDFRLASPEEMFTPTLNGDTDSIHAVKFKESLKDMYRLHIISKKSISAEKPKVPMKLNEVSNVILDQLRPQKTVPAWTWQQVFLPAWLKDQQAYEEFAEIMGYPKINRAMYADLKKISDELFLPNVHMIAQLACPSPLVEFCNVIIGFTLLVLRLTCKCRVFQCAGYIPELSEITTHLVSRILTP